MVLVDLIAPNCRGDVDESGGFTVDKAALNQLLGDGRVIGVRFSGGLLGLDEREVSRSYTFTYQVVFPFGQPQEAYRIALPPQPTDPNAYLVPAGAKQRQRIAQLYETKGGIMLRKEEIARLNRYAAPVQLAYKE